MGALLRDLKYGLRQLRRNPGYTAVAIITLALGIGANTAIFTLVYAVMLKSLPVANPSELYRVGTANNCCVNGGLQGNWDLYSYDLYKQFRDHTPEFSQMAAFQAALTDLSVRRRGASGPAQPFQGEFVSGNYFSMFGIGPYAGRIITPADDQPNAPPAAIMSYRAWQQFFGSDSSVIGSTFVLNMVPYTVVGVAPPGFFGDTLRSDPPDFWLPLATEPVLNGQNSILKNPALQWLHVIGRLKPGEQPSVVQTEVTTELQRWLGVQPDLTAYERSQLSKQHIIVAPGGEGVANMQDQARDGLRLLVIIAGLVLLIACANIANLLLARSASKRFETAVRVALGASRANVLRLVLRSAMLQLVLGLAVGAPLALAGGRLASSMLYGVKSYDPWILAVAALVLAACAALAAFLPARRAAKVDPLVALRYE